MLRLRVRPADYDEDSKMTIETSADVAVVPTFDAMGLKEDLLRGIYSYGPFSRLCTGVPGMRANALHS